jgi:SAM-dependent methyltransferase
MSANGKVHNTQTEQWGTADWQQQHFPEQDLDTVGDTWGIRWRGVEKLRLGSYLRMLQDVLGPPQSLDVLDVGCALCDFTSKAAALNPANRFSVMDIAPNAISWVQRRFPQFEARVGALPNLVFDGPFDVVLCLEVLCYLDRAGRSEAIENIANHLRADGILVFSGVLDGGLRYHSEEEVLGLISRSFKVEHVRYNHWRIYKRILEAPLDRVQHRLESLASRINHAPAVAGASESLMQRALRASSPVSRPSVTIAKKITRGLLGSRSLAEAAHALSTRMHGSRNADEIVVVARRI